MMMKKGFPDFINKAVGKINKQSGEPFVLSMLGITIVAKGRLGKAIFLSIAPTLIGSATLTLGSLESWAPTVLCHITNVREMLGIPLC